MGSNKAKVEIGVEGAAEAERKLNKLKDSFKAFGGEMAGALTGAIKGLASLSMELNRVEPGALAQKFRDFRGTVTEFSVASGRAVDQVKASFASLSKQTLLPDEQVASFTATLSKATYDFKDSGKALTSLRAEGVAAGRALEEMAPIAETLHNVFGESFDEMPQTLGDIRAAAEQLGTSGGPAALQDQITSLGSVLSEVSIKGAADAKGLVAILASFGKGLAPEQKKRVQQELLNTFVGGGEQLRRNLQIKTEDYYDENGQVKVNASNLKRLRDYNIKQAGGNVAEARRRSALRHGGMYSAALYNPSLDSDLDAAGNAVRSAAPEQAMSDLKGSQHGVETQKQNDRDRRNREEVGGITNAAQQKMADLAPSDPIVRAITMGFASVVASNLLGKGVSSALEAGFKSLAPLFAGAAPAAEGGSAAPALAAGGAAVGGPVAIAAAALGYTALHNQALDSVAAGIHKGQSQDDADLASGRKKRVQHWWNFGGASLEDVPQDQQASQAAKYREESERNGKTKDQNVKVTVGFAQDTPLAVVSVEKGSAGRQ